MIKLIDGVIKMPFCSACGLKALDNARFCSGCGQALNAISTDSTSRNVIEVTESLDKELETSRKLDIKSNTETSQSVVFIRSLPTLLNTTNKVQLIINGEEQENIFYCGDEQKILLSNGINTVQAKITSASFLKLKTNVIKFDISSNETYFIDLRPNELLPGFNLKLKKS